jgi:hypothetical protein
LRSGPDKIAAGGIPDYRFINRQIPVREVAKLLGVREGTNGLLHCWHPDRHHNGDRTASVAVHPTLNTAKCFGHVCDIGPIGPIDVVVDILGCSLWEAGLWIAERFDIPEIPKGKHLAELAPPIHQAGYEGQIGLLVGSGIWSRLSEASRCLIPILFHFAKRDRHQPVYRLTMSYRALGQYSGLASQTAISRALTELEGIHFLERLGGRTNKVTRTVNCYVLTPESDELRELANVISKQTRDEVQAERRIRQQQRKRREEIL